MELNFFRNLNDKFILKFLCIGYIAPLIAYSENY